MSYFNNKYSKDLFQIFNIEGEIVSFTQLKVF